MLPTLEQVCTAVGYTLEQLRERNRHRTIAEARILAYALLHRKAGYSLHEVGDMLQRDHATVHYGVRKWETTYDIDKNIQKKTTAAYERLAWMKLEKTLKEAAAA
jgi:chromosomal replication initiation ATPase DnaA